LDATYGGIQSRKIILNAAIRWLRFLRYQCPSGTLIWLPSLSTAQSSYGLLLSKSVFSSFTPCG